MLLDNALTYGDGEVALSVWASCVVAPTMVTPPSRGRRTGGYGLGLAIVHQVVTAHQSRVTVDDAPGGGARFVIDLPAGPASPAVGPGTLAR